MIIRKAELETVCGYTSKIPENTLPEIAFAGKSNVGKSSLINTLLERKSLARTSSQPGKTQTINFYNINDVMYLTDLPGYGYARITVSEKEKWGEMIENYLHTSTQLKAVFLLIDIRHQPSENDCQMYNWMVYQGFYPIIIATKADKLKPAEINDSIFVIRNVLQVDEETIVLPFSAVTGQGKDEIWALMEELIGYEEEPEPEQVQKTRDLNKKPRWKDTGKPVAKKTARRRERPGKYGGLNMYDLIIIGSGPAGMTAAIYGARAELDMIVIEKNFMSGGQVINTYEVDNYPALPGISGIDLSMKMREHCDNLGVSFVTDEVTKIEDLGDHKLVKTVQGEYEAKAVLLASGADHSRLGIPGEDTFSGKGVSYCATCDGAFFRNKTVAVIGGGNVAVEDAIYLANLCEKVYVVHRRDELRAEKVLQNKLLSLENVEMVWNANAVRIEGEKKTERLIVKDKFTEAERTLDVDGVFVAVGIVPNAEPFNGIADQDKAGYFIAGEDGATSTPGIFVAGDLRAKSLRQIITAAGDGANAIHAIQQYLLH